MALRATAGQLTTLPAAAFSGAGAGVAAITWPGAGSGGAVWRRTAGNVLDSVLDADASLVERCLDGDETAWEALVKTHTRRVYAICYRFTGKDSEAQDLSQDVFLRVFKSLRTFRAGEGSFVVWLTRLTRNLLIDHYRRTRVERATESIEEQLPMLEETQAMSARTDGMLAGREASELLQAALAKLSPELRETVILRDLEELEYREIASALGIPEGTVKSRLNRGRAELARILKRQKVLV
ncbi:MAG: sigma-70 family RNA polymerase sigma factor [Bryobacter sp.]|jgi:RNA polymerase sigma-70 factor (ECF subfamily)|nr:sigma-70 family RNA polymerase sigma factor [Bryobacter sp.]